MVAPTSLRDTRVKRFSPVGVSDSLDATDEFPGSCYTLSNLVPDLTTRNLWTCRPGAYEAPNMLFANCPNLTAGHSNGPISVYKVVGNIVYGLFYDTTANADVPFAFNLLTDSWITVTGSGIHPSPSAGIPIQVTIPPTIDLIGTNLCVTHPSFASPNYFGWFDIATPSAPTWNTGDLTSGGAITFSSLGSIPAWVKQFNERAYFGVNNLTQPSVIATDVLSLKVTNAGQVLTFGDNLPLTCAGVLGLSNQLGGIIQSIMVFKGATNIYQVTGDYALSNWVVNTLNVATGTLSPRSICSTPLGLAFLSPLGVRIIDQNATVSDPIGAAGKGVTVPFSIEVGNIIYPWTASMGCDGVTLRVSYYRNTTQAIEYWFNLVRKVWSGPHNFGALGSGVQYDVYNGMFIYAPMAGSLTPAQCTLYFSPTDPSSSSVFTELGNPMSFLFISSLLEDNSQMALSDLSEIQVVAAASASLSVTVELVDSVDNTINTSTLTVNPNGNYSGVFPWRVDFPAQSVFNRMAVQMSGLSAAGVRFGDIWLRIKTLGYIDNYNP